MEEFFGWRSKLGTVVGKGEAANITALGFILISIVGLSLCFIESDVLNAIIA